MESKTKMRKKTLSFSKILQVRVGEIFKEKNKILMGLAILLGTTILVSCDLENPFAAIGDKIAKDGTILFDKDGNKKEPAPEVDPGNATIRLVNGRTDNRYSQENASPTADWWDMVRLKVMLADGTLGSTQIGEPSDGVSAITELTEPGESLVVKAGNKHRSMSVAFRVPHSGDRDTSAVWTHTGRDVADGFKPAGLHTTGSTQPFYVRTRNFNFEKDASYTIKVYVAYATQNSDTTVRDSDGNVLYTFSNRFRRAGEDGEYDAFWFEGRSIHMILLDAVKD